MAKFTEQPILTDRFSQALVWAEQLHRKQVRKGTIPAPYIAHLMSVASLVLEAGGGEDLAISALLHDCLEDVEVTANEVQARFGLNVAAVVIALSEDKEIPKSDRKLQYIEKLKHSNTPVVLVSACDKLHNLRGYLANPQLISDEVIWFYRQLFPVYLNKLSEKSIIMQEFIKLMRELP